MTERFVYKESGWNDSNNNKTIKPLMTQISLLMLLFQSYDILFVSFFFHTSFEPQIFKSLKYSMG